MIANLHSVIDLAQALVRIPSVNPDGDPGTTEVGEANCAAFIADFLLDCDAEVEIEEIEANRPNVVGRFPSDRPGKPRILFAPHSDTVGVGGMVIDPFGGEIRDGRLWGRGSSDTKGPMAAMLWALRMLGKDIASLPVEVHFAAFMSEESSQLGSRHFAATQPPYHLALIGEPTALQVVHKHKGCLWADVVTTGIAAHGARPELGVNAISKMAPIIQALESDFRDLLIKEGGHDELLGHSTINLGMINGGTRSNIVADRCRLRVDIRVTPELQAKGGALTLLRRFVEPLGATVEPLPEAPALDTDSQHPLIQQLLHCGSTLAGAPWFCDAAYLAQCGTPSIAIGPGSIDQAHTKDEWIALDALTEGALFFEKFLRSIQ
jgi:acetylornithine deacetylase/succinyl-diaminopimelate desuccinylase-like protein